MPPYGNTVDAVPPAPAAAEPILPTHEPEMTPPVPADAQYHGYAEPAARPVRDEAQPEHQPEPEPVYAASYREQAGVDEARYAHAPLVPSATPPRQNWWQRLLGLGHG